MKPILIALITTLPLAALCQTPNKLTKEEKKEGWQLLFNGKTTHGWHTYGQTSGSPRWKVEDEAITPNTADKGHGDLLTDQVYENFDLKLEWKISPGGNSGIMTRVSEDHDHPWETGPEMQILDNAQHDDGRNPMTSAGACYALYAPKWDLTRQVGAWNRVRILVHGAHTEYWLNGERVVEYELGDADWKKRVAESKFAAMPDFAKRPKGRIALQDHGDRVSFRNIKIRPIQSR